MKFRITRSLVVLMTVFWGNMATATELAYTPVNPSFGGNPLNGSWLLGSASAQNPFKDTTSQNMYNIRSGISAGTDPLTIFKTQLENRILSALTDKLMQQAFGESGLTAGTYTIGNMKVVIDTSDPTITVMTITDMNTGNITTIQIPTM